MAKRKSPKKITETKSDASKFTNASVQVVSGGTGKMHPYNNNNAINQFRGWVMAAASMNANTVASVPLRLYVRNKPSLMWQPKSVSKMNKKYLNGELKNKPSSIIQQKTAQFGDDFVEIVDHPVLDTLRQPNPYDNSFNFTFMRILYGELVGNSYIYVAKNNLNVPAELYCLPAQWVYVVEDKETIIGGYKYGKNSSNMTEFDVEEIIHFKRPNPKGDGIFYGMGKVEQAWAAINQFNAYSDTYQAMFDNNCRPDFAVIYEGSPSQEEIDRSDEYIKNVLQGRNKRGKHLSLSNVTITPLTFQNDILGDKASEDMVEQIAAVFGVSITKLKGNDPNRANAAIGDYSYMKNTILPLCRMDEEILNSKYLPMWGIEDDAVLAYDSCVPEDVAADNAQLISLKKAGIISQNEARLELGYEPVENGDDLIVDNTQPITNVNPTINVDPAKGN